MDGIRYWIEAEGNGHWFFIAFPVCLFILFIWFKGRRVRFLIPSLLISTVIINPWFYKKWNELGLYAYWRILWIVPVIPVIAGVIPSITEKIRKSWLKSIVVAIGIGMFVFGGTFLYNGPGGSFVEANNAAKLPDNVVAVADRLLEFDKHPRVITQDPVGVYIRQYTGSIDTLYGRDLHGYIHTASKSAQEINQAINTDSFSTISEEMLNEEYDYLVMISRETDDSLKLIDCIGQFSIYAANGNPTKRVIRNEQGQVISISILDENGKLINNENGIATIIFDYDSEGNIIREFHTNVEGEGVADDKGIAGYEWAWDNFEHIVMERTLGENGKPITAFQRYAEVRREFRGDKVVREQYYDEEGNPAIQLAGYAGIAQEWNDNRLVSKVYLDADGNPINRIDGYSKADWANTDVVFYDIDGNTVPLEGINLYRERTVNLDGWSEWITPNLDTNNHGLVIGYYNLGEKKEEDVYSCQFEIEFKNVSCSNPDSFLFCTQGTTDGAWSVWNPWDHIVYLTDVPEDGIYHYSTTCVIDKKMAEAKEFQIGFRCDNWDTGSFRIRKIKIEKSNVPSDWSPGI